MMTETQNPDISLSSRPSIRFVAIAAAIVLMLVVAAMAIQASQARQASQQSEAMAMLRVLALLGDGLDDGANNLDARLHAMLSLPTRSRAFYLGIISPEGEWLHSVGQVPKSAIRLPSPRTPDQWYGDRMIEQASGRLIEYFAPVIEHGQLVAFAVAGYALPSASAFVLSDGAIASLLLVSVILLLLAWHYLRPDGLRQNIDGQDPSVITPDAGSPDDAHPVRTSTRQLRVVKSEKSNSGDQNNVVSSKLLQKQSDRLSAMLEALPTAVLLLDTRGSVEYGNHRLYQLFDLQPGTLLGSGIEQWCKHDSIAEVLGSAQILYDSKCHYRRFDVSTDKGDLQLELCPLPGVAEQDKTGVLVLFYENEAVCDKSSSLSGFVSHVAHQIKTPLNTIFMYSEVLQHAGSLSEEQSRRAANVIYRETARMARLVDNLLNISMLQSGSVSVSCKPVETATYVEMLVKLMRSSEPERSRDIRIYTDATLPAMTIDRDLMQLALMQLIDNAIHYSEAGTAIDIEVRECNGSIRIDIRDRGIGISLIDQQQMFEMFYRSEQARVREVKGNGLGLTLAKQIIDLHGGTLLCDSQPGKGTTFSVVLGKANDKLEGVA